MSPDFRPNRRREMPHFSGSGPEVSRRDGEALTWFTKKRAEWDNDADSKWRE